LGLVCKLSCCSIKINQILTRCFLSKSQFAPPICIHKSLVESDEAFASSFSEKTLSISVTLLLLKNKH
jgi:hypothetical protein